MPSPELLQTPVRSAVELTARWADMLEPPVFGARQLWLAWVGDDGLMLPIVTPIDDIPLRPEPDLLPGLRSLHEAVAGSQAGRMHLALALCRPGRPAVLPDDAAWAEALREEVGAHVDGTWSLHLAAGGSVLPIVNPPLWAWS
jgi:hypothetical protein